MEEGVRLAEALANKYRPTKFDEMIGQPMTARVLEKMVETHSVPRTLLFSGPSGVGKTTAARILARALNNGDVGVKEVDGASHGLVANVREIMDNLVYSSGGQYRILIIDEAHSLSKDAFNALLKKLEEPMESVVIILVTTEPFKIPETVLSRLFTFEFHAVSAENVYQRMKFVTETENIQVDERLMAFLSSEAQGNVRKALMLLDQVILSEIKTVEGYKEATGETDFAPILLASMLTNDYSLIYETLEKVIYKVGNPSVVSTKLLELFRDILILRAGGQLRMSGTPFNNRKSLASRLDSQRILSACKLLWDLKTRIRVSDDLKSDLELSLVLMSDIMTKGNTKIAPKTEKMTTDSRPMTAEELKQFTQV